MNEVAYRLPTWAGLLVAGCGLAAIMVDAPEFGFIPTIIYGLVWNWKAQHSGFFTRQDDPYIFWLVMAVGSAGLAAMLLIAAQRMGLLP